MNQYLNRRLLAILFLGFSSGLPIALCAGTLQAWYTTSGVDIVTIGMLTLVGIPYVYKFAWAPLLDRYVPPFLGRRRGWILMMQIILALVLVIMACLDPKNYPGLLALIALVLAFFSATQDIAINAYTADVLQPPERGLGAAMTTAGYRVAMLVSGALALIMAATIGWREVYLLMAGLMAMEIFITFASPEPQRQKTPPRTLREAIVEPFREFLSRPWAKTILLFIIIYKLSDALALALGTPFLLRYIGFSLQDVGVIYKVVGLGATIIGSFLGGAVMVRLGLYRSLLYFGLLQGTSNLLFMALAILGKNYALLVSAVFLENFCSGLGTVALVALLMSLCDLRYTAAQYAILSSVSAVGRVFIGPIAGELVKYVGWANFFLITFLITFPSLILLWFLREQINASEQQTSIRSTVQANQT